MKSRIESSGPVSRKPCMKKSSLRGKKKTRRETRSKVEIKRIELVGLWAKQGKEGEIYYSGKATNGTIFQLFKNRLKEPGDNRPAFILFLAAVKPWQPKEPEQKEFEGSDGELPF